MWAEGLELIETCVGHNIYIFKRQKKVQKRGYNKEIKVVWNNAVRWLNGNKPKWNRYSDTFIKYVFRFYISQFTLNPTCIITVVYFQNNSHNKLHNSFFNNFCNLLLLPDTNECLLHLLTESILYP